jgi:NADH dehydrogenase
MPASAPASPAPVAQDRSRWDDPYGAANDPRVLIIGAGFAGLYAALRLRHARARVTLVDRRNHHLFQPLLYQVATAGLSPGDIAYPIRAILRRQDNTRVLLAEVTQVDLDARQVHLRDGVLDYDYLILAAGSSHKYFGHSEWEPLAPSLKSLEDALEIRRRILLAFERAEREPDPGRRLMLLTFVVIGAGPTGVELAGAIAEIARDVMVRDFRHIDPREARVILVEAGARILPAFPPDLAAKAGAELQAKGVEIRTGAAVTAIEPQQVCIRGAAASPDCIPTATALWAAGVAASPLGRQVHGHPEPELDRSGRIVVHPDLTLPGHREVFVIGDLAACHDARGRLLPGLAPVAMQQGRAAADNIRRASLGRPLRPFTYRDKGQLATIGRGAAIAEIGPLHFSGVLGWWIWATVHILYLIGFRNRFVVAFEWGWSYLNFSRGARLITGRLEPEPGERR